MDADGAEKSLEQAAGFLSGAQRIAALTGAGISAESGLATFRGAGGLWEGQRVEDVATPMAFNRDPALVWRFYNARRAALRSRCIHAITLSPRRIITRRKTQRNDFPASLRSICVVDRRAVLDWANWSMRTNTNG